MIVGIIICVLSLYEPRYEIQRQTNEWKFWAIVSKHQRGAMSKKVRIYYQRHMSEFELIKSAFPECGERPKIHLLGFEASRD